MGIVGVGNGRAVKFGMDIEPELDRGGHVMNLWSGDREGGLPFVSNNGLCIHKARELTSSPASSHAIYALQRTAPDVTLAAPATSLRSPPATFPQPARRPPQSLSLGSLGDSAHIP